MQQHPIDGSILAQPSETTTQNSCENDNPADDGLNLSQLCNGCSAKRLVGNSNSQQRYIECNGGGDKNTNSVKKM